MEMSPSDKKKIIIFYIVVCNVLKKITVLYIEIVTFRNKKNKNTEGLTQSLLNEYYIEIFLIMIDHIFLQEVA